MNVDDVSDVVIPSLRQGKDRLDLIFERQEELMKTYGQIEKANGFPHFNPKIGRNLHDRYFQHHLKDQAWRVTEEIAEAIEAVRLHGHIVAHFYEEISDAYHFLMELTILSNVTPEDLFKMMEPGIVSDECKLKILFDKAIAKLDFNLAWLDVIVNLGVLMNTLKNKPWKRSHMLTDETRYMVNLACTHKAFLSACRGSNIEADDLFRIYFKKSEVNKFRQRSQY